jgi:hypothetical protein
LYAEDELRPLHKTFADPRFPASLIPLQNKALSNRYMQWAIFAYLQDATAWGKEYILKTVELNPGLVDGTSNELLETILHFCTMDDSLDHETLLRKLLQNLPNQLEAVSHQLDWAIARGYLIRGVRAVMWDRMQEGDRYFSMARFCGAQIDRNFLGRITSLINSYEIEFGSDAAEAVLEKLAPFLEQVGNREDISWLKGCRAVNIGFTNFAHGAYNKVPRAVLHAIINDPSYLFNRGVIKILLVSLMSYHKTQNPQVVI